MGMFEVNAVAKETSFLRSEGKVGDFWEPRWGLRQRRPIAWNRVRSLVTLALNWVFGDRPSQKQRRRALPKSGLSCEAARNRVGELYLGDISVPPQLYRGPGLGLDVGPVFAKDDVIRLW